MRYPAIIILMAAIILRPASVMCKTIEDYIGEAEMYQQSGEIDRAVQTMETALEEHSDNPTIMAFLGSYTGLQAGMAFESGDMNSAGELTAKAFELLDRAVEIDSDNMYARLHRGVMGINVPEFFGRLSQGIEDLEIVITLHTKNPDSVPDQIYLNVLNGLGDGYAKSGKLQKAYRTLQKILELVPGTPLAEQVDKKLKNYMTSDDRQAQTTESLAVEFPHIGVITKKLKNDPDNPELLYDLAMAYGAVVENGYNEHIYEDTTYLTNIAFEMVNLLDKAAKKAPDNMKIRLASGMSSIMMPFFVNRLNRGIDDLTVVIESDAPESIKAEAHFWLGYAYSKKATTEWVKVISDYPKTDAATMTFDYISPPVKQFDRDEHPEPCVAIDFILGFRDELAPQTSVWIEDFQGNFVKTVYVSGFSGYAKEKQVNLPKWSKSSGYADVDGVTAASIDLRRHLYVWNLKDSTGNQVKPGKYTVKVETSYWPSMKYQSVSTSITIGSKENRSKIEEGHFIPYMEAVYYP